MKTETASAIQRIIWHVRWILLAVIMVYNIFSFGKSFQLSSYLPVHGFVFAFYFFLGLWEDYFMCKSSCKS